MLICQRGKADYPENSHVAFCQNEYRFFLFFYPLCVWILFQNASIVQELCESRGGRPGLSVLTSRLVSVDVKLY